MQSTFQTYSDPGHGWARVPKSLLVALGIADKVSRYSYQRGDFAYLEEDCDMSLFFNAYRERTGRDPVLRHRTSDKRSKIRGYDTYQHC